MTKSFLIAIHISFLTIGFAQQTISVKVPKGYFSDFSALNKNAGFDFTTQVEKSLVDEDLSSIDYLITDINLRAQLQNFLDSIQSIESKSTWKVHGHSNSSFGEINGVYDDYSLALPAKLYKNSLSLEKVERDINLWLNFEYTYTVIDSNVRIDGFTAKFVFKNFGENPKQISINSSFPLEFDEFNSIANQIFNSSLSYRPYSEQLKQLNKQEFIRDSLLNQISDLSHFNFYQKMKSNLAYFMGKEYGNLAWYALLSNEESDALKFAKKGLDLAPDQKWIYTNLSIAYLLNDEYKQAKKVYKKYMHEAYTIKDKKFGDIFIADLEKLDILGIKDSNLTKALLFLKRKMGQ